MPPAASPPPAPLPPSRLPAPDSFTAGDAAGVSSWSTRLNGGGPLGLGPDGKLPPLPGAVVPAAGGMTLPPQSATLVVLPALSPLPACGAATAASDYG